MIKIHPPFIAPLASIMTLILGAGFYTTLTTLDLTERGVDKWIIGCISSSYFSGLLISAFRSQHFILRVGHIRAFAAYATLMCVTSLFQGLFFSPTLWVLLRFLSGYALAGLAVVVESWLMDASDKNDRGTILAVYMFGYYLAQSISQIFLTLEYKEEIEQYILIAIFAALSILPVCMTRFPAPTPTYPNILPFQHLFKRAPLGILVCISSGLLLGPIYTLFPDYLHENNKLDNEVGFIMMAVILGGTLLQYPFGRLSDQFDRRLVIVSLCAASIVTICFFLLPFYGTLWLIFLGFFLGGFTFTLYPLGVGHALDHVKKEDMISAISTLLLSYGAGSAVGPLIAPIFTKLLGNTGICFYILLVGIILAIYTVREVLIKRTYKYDEHVEFVGIPVTTPNAIPDLPNESSKEL